MNAQAQLGKDKVGSLVLKLAIPAMVAQFVNVLYSIIDRMYIGHIPKIGGLALAGVGVCGPIVTLLSSFGTWIGLGGSIIMSIKLGEGNKKTAQDVLGISFIMLSIVSVILTISFLAGKNFILMWFGASNETFTYANTYMTIYTIGTFFALMATGLNYFINCQGFPIAGMATVLIGAILNIILDPIFIFGFNLGVSGGAIATVISQICACFYALFYLLRKTPITIKLCPLIKPIIKRILFLGLSPFIILATDSVLLIVMNSVLQHYGGATEGDKLITCATISQSYLLMITAPMLGISGGTQAILSFNYGACQIDRVKAAEKKILVLMLSFTTSMFIISRLLPKFFVELFTSNPVYIDCSVWSIKVFTLMIIPLSFQYCFVDGLTALERTKTALFLSIFRKAIFVGGTIIFPILLGAKAAFYAQPVADGIASVISFLIFISIIDRHLKRRVAFADGDI